MMSDKGFVVLALGVLALMSCATTERSFEGSERSRSEVALFTGMNPLDPGIGPRGWASQIQSVDGRPVSGSGTKVEVLPGQHELVVYCKRPGANPTNDKYTVTVEAGAEYVIGVKPGTNKCQFTNRLTKKEAGT